MLDALFAYFIVIFLLISLATAWYGILIIRAIAGWLRCKLGVEPFDLN